LEREFKKKIIACKRSDITPKMATRSATVKKAAKWRLAPRKPFMCSRIGLMLKNITNSDKYVDFQI
jgi:hypothetical protein